MSLLKRWRSSCQVAKTLSRVVKLRNCRSVKRPQKPGRNKERRAATLLTCIGSDVIDVMEFENEEEVILEKMKEYYIGECNETSQRYVFNRRNRESNESVDAFVTSLRN